MVLRGDGAGQLARGKVLSAWSRREGSELVVADGEAQRRMGRWFEVGGESEAKPEVR